MYRALPPTARTDGSSALTGSPRREVYGPFEVMERLGIGGMATVHRAVERGIEGFERVVALKRLLPHLAEDEAFVRAFVREAKLASLLQHGNIVQLYELGRVGASYFISMEYIRGRDARRILRQAKRMTGPLPVGIAVAIVSELLDALDYAHTRADDNGTPLGLVHRDISPSNLLISHTGHLKVIDFGIAKATLGHLATHTGRIKGKLSYMAPEALTGKSSLDNRSDLFSASIIAHELLTAHPLFAARNDFHTIERVQTMEAPPPSERNPEVPPALDALVLRGLSKDPALRWRSAGEMRAALAEITLRHRLHCTNREVADWVEIAFALGHSQEFLPNARAVAAASHLPLPLAASAEAGSGPGGTQPYGMVPRPGSEDSDSEEILDLVWDENGAGEAAPIIVDGVPDVSLRFTLADPIEEEDDPTSIDSLAPRVPSRPMTGLPDGDGEARVTFKPPPAPPPATPSVSGELAAVGEEPEVPRATTVPMRGGKAKGVRAPRQWATGTSPATNRPSRRDLGIQGTGPTSALEPEPSDSLTQVERPTRIITPVEIGGGIVGRRLGPSRITWVVGAVAAGAVLGLVLWAMTRGGDDKPSKSQNEIAAAAAAPGKRVPINSAATASAPIPTASPLRLPDAPARAAASAPSDQTSDRKKKRSRDTVAAMPAPATPAVRAAVPTAPAAPAAAPPGAVPPRAPSLVPSELRPLPVPVKEPPARARAIAAAAPASAAPILVTPNRAHRRSGSIPTLRGTRSANPIRAITAKLCVDRKGSVTAVSILSKVDAQVKRGLTDALERWRYDPIVEGGSAVPACFATTFRVTQK
jgi:eukaryotic-like serine/threonine-protein kinase